MQRNASAHWEGGIKQGEGSVSTDSGVLQDRPYSYDTRFNGGKGTNPEELLGAAHAGCFSMALAKILDDQGHRADSIDTQAGETSRVSPTQQFLRVSSLAAIDRKST